MLTEFLARIKMPPISGGARYVISLMMIGQGILRIAGLNTLTVHYTNPIVFGLLQVVSGLLFLVSAFNGWRGGWFGRISAAICASTNMLAALAVMPILSSSWSALILSVFCILEAAQNERHC